MNAGRPDAEVDVDEALVRALLADQHPDLAELPVEPLDSGWDNVMFRLGNLLTVRMPRREVAAQLIVNEQTWLPHLQPLLPLDIPAPVKIGRPAAGYPWRWSVVPWFEGASADARPPAASEAPRWAHFLRRLHQPAPENAPVNPVRGIALEVRADTTRERMTRLQAKSNLVGQPIQRAWEAGLLAGVASERCWLHGDLHAQNVVVHNSRLRAVIDWGDITGGDPATDLASIWGLFADPAARETVLNHYGPDQATLERARGWAVIFGVVLLDSGLINSPRHAAMGRDILTCLARDA